MGPSTAQVNHIELRIFLVCTLKHARWTLAIRGIIGRRCSQKNCISAIRVGKTPQHVAVSAEFQGLQGPDVYQRSSSTIGFCSQSVYVVVHYAK